MQCGHICASSCGPCLKHRRSLEAARQTPADAADAAGHHLPCHQKCSRLLVCGHPCTRTCHAATEPCSDCSRACPMACPHARCSLGCSQVSLISATLSDFLHQPLQPIIPRFTPACVAYDTVGISYYGVTEFCNSVTNTDPGRI